MIKETLKAGYGAYIQPYLIWFKIGLLITLFAAGWFSSTKYHNNADAQVDAEQAAEIATLRKANYDYEQADLHRKALADAEKAAQKEREKEAAKAVEEAQERADTLAAKLKAIAERQAKAATDPKCRDIMEQEVCPALRR